MKNQTKAARLGRIAGIAYREIARVMREVDWEEVGTIVLRGAVAAVVLTYCLGLWTGRAVHGASRWLGEHWPTRPVVDHRVTPRPVVDHVVRIHEQQPIVRARWMVARGCSKSAISRELGIPRTTLRRMLAA